MHCWLTLCGPNSSPIILVSISNAAFDEPVEIYMKCLCVCVHTIRGVVF